MSVETVAPSDLQAQPAVQGARERLLALRRRVVTLDLAQEGWLLLGGCGLAFMGLLITALSWPTITTDEFGSIVEGSAAWSAVGIGVASIGGLLCVAAAAAYGVLLGQERRAQVDEPA